MKDILENLEHYAEKRYDEMEQPDGRLKCDCGNLFNAAEGEVLSPNPYAMPVCQECFKKLCDVIPRKRR
jgi:hypothetical protein